MLEKLSERLSVKDLCAIILAGTIICVSAPDTSGLVYIIFGTVVAAAWQLGHRASRGLSRRKVPEGRTAYIFEQTYDVVKFTGCMRGPCYVLSRADHIIVDEPRGLTVTWPFTQSDGPRTACTVCLNYRVDMSQIDEVLRRFDWRDGLEAWLLEEAVDSIKKSGGSTDEVSRRINGWLLDGAVHVYDVKVAFDHFN